MFERAGLKGRGKPWRHGPLYWKCNTIHCNLCSRTFAQENYSHTPTTQVTAKGLLAQVSFGVCNKSDVNRQILETRIWYEHSLPDFVLLTFFFASFFLECVVFRISDVDSRLIFFPSFLFFLVFCFCRIGGKLIYKTVDTSPIHIQATSHSTPSHSVMERVLYSHLPPNHTLPLYTRTHLSHPPPHNTTLIPPNHTLPTACKKFLFNYVPQIFLSEEGQHASFMARWCSQV